jgi:hypothetical protein
VRKRERERETTERDDREKRQREETERRQRSGNLLEIHERPHRRIEEEEEEFFCFE